MRFIVSILLLLILTGCSEVKDDDRPIGTAKMESDGTIVLDLIAEAGSSRGHARFTYSRTDKEYDEIISHLGELEPGEEKIVPPWENK